MSAEPLIAVFVDFENLAIGVRDMKSGDFEIRLVLKRLLEKGRIVYKRAYCDWRNLRRRRTGVSRPGNRTDRHSAEQDERQEQCGHSHGRGCTRSLLLEAAHRCLRLDFRRQRFLAAGFQAQGEQQTRHRLRGQEFHVRSADRQLRRVHLLR